MDADFLRETLALIILGYGTDGCVTIPKSLIDAFSGQEFEIVHDVDWQKEEVILRLILTNTGKTEML